MDTLEILTADHERLRDVLALLKRELTACEAGANADLQLMQDIVTHYSEYFNRVHHPLEDHMFEYVLRRGGTREEGAKRALMEHGELISHTARLGSLLDQALHGGIMLRDELVGAGRRFLDSNLDHMANEERTAFAWARESLEEADWTAIRSRTAAHDRMAAGSALVQDELAKYLRQVN